MGIQVHGQLFIAVFMPRCRGTEQKDYFYEDASFLRLRNISVAFDFAKFIHTRFPKTAVSFGRKKPDNSNELYRLIPKLAPVQITPRSTEVDHNTIPNLKSYQVGLNLGF